MLFEHLISTVGGMTAGLLPTGLSMLKGHFAAKQELKLLRAQAEIQQQLGTLRLDDTQLRTDAAALAAAYQHDTAGIDRAPAWAVALRVLQRPALSWAVIGTFAWAAAYSLTAGIIEPADIFNRTAHFANTVLGFYFVSREMRKIGGEK